MVSVQALVQDGHNYYLSVNAPPPYFALTGEAQSWQLSQM